VSEMESFLRKVDGYRIEYFIVNDHELLRIEVDEDTMELWDSDIVKFIKVMEEIKELRNGRD